LDIVKSAKITPTINEAIRMPILTKLLCDFSAFGSGFGVFIRLSLLGRKT